MRSSLGVDPLLSSLRLHALAALGLTSGLGACASSTRPERDRDDAVFLPPPPPLVVASASGEPELAPPGDGQAKLCGPDELRDVACTESKGAVCAGSASLETRFWVSGIQAWSSQAPFIHDPGLSSEVSALEPSRPQCCYQRCTPFKVAASAPPPIPPKGSELGVTAACQPMPDAPSRFPAPGAERCAAAAVLQHGKELRPFREQRSSRGEGSRRAEGWPRGLCCYDDLRDLRGVGRAYRVRGRRTLARDDVPPFDPVAAHWHEVARGEHASVFAFAALAGALEAHAAPAELVRAARGAQRDEVRHARFAYRWLERVSGVRVRPGALPAPRPDADLETLALEALRDGAFEESLGAALAAHLAEVADDPTLAAALRAIAREEARHAELSWRVLSFALAREPELGPTLRAELERLTPPEAPCLPSPEDVRLERLGVPSATTRLALAERVLREVVCPCLEAALERADAPQPADASRVSVA
jgi:hypothetical protein